MIRTIAYRPRRDAAELAEERPVYGEGGEIDERLQVETDGLLARILKFIPADTLSLVLPASLIPGLTEAEIWIVAAAGAVGTPLWLRRRARHEWPATRRPPLRYYAIAVLAYGAWILASSSPVRHVVGANQGLAALMVFLASYFLPLLDYGLDQPPGDGD